MTRGEMPPAARRAGTSLGYRRRVRRRGVMTALLLVCLLLVAILGAALVRNGMTERRRMAAEERRLQADWLVESGLDRAAARLAAGEDFSGEVWEIEAGELGGAAGARVTIRAEPVPGAPRQRAVRVQADYPRDSDLRARASKRQVLPAAPVERGTQP